MNSNDYKCEFIEVSSDNDDISIFEKINGEINKYIKSYKSNDYYVDEMLLVCNTNTKIRYLIVFKKQNSCEPRFKSAHDTKIEFEWFGGGGGNWKT